MKAVYDSMRAFSAHQVHPSVRSHLSQDLKPSLDFISDRYGLQLIEHMAFPGIDAAFLGRNVRNNIPLRPGANPDLFRDTINTLTGCIFITPIQQ